MTSKMTWVADRLPEMVPRENGKSPSKIKYLIHEVLTFLSPGIIYMSREESLKLTKIKLRNSKTKEEFTKFWLEHFRNYVIEDVKATEPTTESLVKMLSGGLGLEDLDTVKI